MSRRGQLGRGGLPDWDEPPRQLYAELRDTPGLPLSVRVVGMALASRMVYASSRGWDTWGGRVSLAARVERDFGITLDQRTVQRALRWLVENAYLKVLCCGGRCRGGRESEARGHAARYWVGAREIGVRAFRRGRFFLRSKCGIGRATLFAPTSLTESKTKEERRSARLMRSRGDVAPPLPRAPTAAAPPGHVAEKRRATTPAPTGPL
jgi:hypothetical protein